MKDKKDYTVDEIIETLFNNFFINDNVLTPIQFNKDGVYEYGFGNKTDSALIKLIAFDIINIDNNRTISLTKEGFKVLNLGGWINYLENLKNIEAIKEADRQLARDVNQSVKRTNLNQVIILWATFAVSLVSLGIAYLTYSREQKVSKNEPIQLYKSDTISVKVISGYQEKINDSTVFSKKP